MPRPRPPSSPIPLAAAALALAAVALLANPAARPSVAALLPTAQRMFPYAALAAGAAPLAHVVGAAAGGRGAAPDVLWLGLPLYALHQAGGWLGWGWVWNGGLRGGRRVAVERRTAAVRHRAAVRPSLLPSHTTPSPPFPRLRSGAWMSRADPMPSKRSTTVRFL